MRKFEGITSFAIMNIYNTEENIIDFPYMDKI